MTTAPYPRSHDLRNEPDEPGDLRALVPRVFTACLRRQPAPDRPAPAHPYLRTET